MLSPDSYPKDDSPQTKGKQKTSHILVVRLTDTQHEMIRDLQKAFGDITAAAVVRRALYELSENLKD